LNKRLIPGFEQRKKKYGGGIPANLTTGTGKKKPTVETAGD
jgi:hypothetical protein